MLQMNRKHVEPDIVVLEMKGRFSGNDECHDVERRVDDLLRENRRKVIFDLSGLEHMDSMGVGSLVMCSAKLRKSGGELRLAGAWGSVEQLLQLTRVNQILGAYLNVPSAAQEFVLLEE